ncbi:pseudouridine synthase [Mitosporidium daphniae]|uniref:Pseudouridine synthase n=1 Tax=Mitosporidium daphniae TaxID=1485682 RepID=A0A098VRQ1_9MICR|nr:pseudouridine synthase [Mitosporidium daphniae]KGG51702.1 pseudouridine synthase [Mitosporidium daphniae]|eukprot:XP_013238129.1 pseudouridine synthase [Mitosporidium daphniae]
MENSVYISEFLTPNLKSFPCILKARYSDFHVTEILPDGTIAKIVSPLPSDAVPMSDDSEDPALTSIESSTAPLAENIVEDDQVEALPPNEVAPKCSISSPVADEPTSDDDWKSKEPWVSLFLADPESIEKLNEFVVSVHSLLSSSESKVIESYPIANKEKRTLIHQYLKHESISKSGFVLYSSTIPETNVITVTRRRLTREKTHAASQSSDACFERPKFVQFYLYKQNRSTMETIGKMAKPAKHFSFAGTKDKRAVTIQRVVINNQGANRISLQRLLSLNKILRSFGMWVSDVKPAADQLLLGTDLWGNRFSIFLRDLSISSGEEIEGNILALKNAGFINYYGAQRFGTVGDFMTHLVGIEILKENWPEVIRLIMAPRPPGQGIAFSF